MCINYLIKYIMKIFNVLALIFVTQVAFCKETNNLHQEIIDQSNGSYIIKVSDGKFTWFHVVAAISTVLLPEAVHEICTRAGGDNKVCRVVYDVTSALVALRGKKIYKGVTNGIYWLANRGQYRSKAVIETATYDKARAIKIIFDTYKKINCINWEDVSASDLSNNKICDIPQISAHSSSYLRPSSYNTYYPSNVLDGDPTTPWVEGANGYGYGEWLKIEFNKKAIINGIMIMNGYNYLNADHVGDRFFKNSRVKSATLKFSDGTYKKIFLKDTNKYQTIHFLDKRTEYVMLKIDDVYKGTKWDDTCISEINILFK